MQRYEKYRYDPRNFLKNFPENFSIFFSKKFWKKTQRKVPPVQSGSQWDPFRPPAIHPPSF
jgi:hypothetical protein